MFWPRSIWGVSHTELNQRLQRSLWVLQVKLLPCPDPGWVRGLLGGSGRCGFVVEMKTFTSRAACECPGTARTNDHTMRGLKQQKGIISVLGVRGSKSRCHRGWSLPLRPPSLSCLLPLSSCDLLWGSVLQNLFSEGRQSHHIRAHPHGLILA